MRLIDADALIVSNKECEQTKTCRTCKMYVKNCEDLFDLIANAPTITAQPEQTRIFVELVVDYPDPKLCTYKEYRGKPYYSIKYIENGEEYVGYGTYNPKILSQYLKEYFIPSAQSKTYKEKLKEIADALSEKFAYMNTCLNERDIILGYLGVKRPSKIHCNTDCTNIKCESHCCNKRLPTIQPKMGKWIKNHSVIRCSECKRSSWSLSFEDLVKSFKYCPNCGVRMKEDNTDG